MQQPLLDHLDVWTQAIEPRSTSGRGSRSKLNLYGIKKLRELILDLAVRGQLVPQEQIAEKIKLSKVIKLISGQHLKADEQNSNEVGIPYFTGASDFGAINPVISRWTEHPKAIACNEDILLSVKGTIGKVNILDIPKASLGRQIMALRPTGMNKEFLAITLLSKEKYFLEMGVGIAIPGISRKDILNLEINLPSIAEQHRIVAKVNELMSLCDALEQAQTQHIQAHQTLVEHLLAALTQAANQGDFEQAWARIAEHFDTLFTTEHSIDQLKQSLLQLAVMGKLVPQNPNDEPASVLLEKIAAEKARLIKEKKIKKQKALPPIADEEKPFELPDGWAWCRLDHLSLNSEAGWSPKCKPTPREGNKWGILKVSAVTWDIFNPEENKELPSHLEPRKHLEVKRGDFLISRANTSELVAKAVVVPENAPSHLIMSDKIIRFTFSESICKEFVNWANNSQLSRSYYLNIAGGTSSSMKNVSREQVRSLLIALPPFVEQKRIVEKINQLTTICDQLKTHLAKQQTTQNQLADALKKL